MENEVWAKCRHWNIQSREAWIVNPLNACWIYTVDISEAPNWPTHAQKQKVWPYKLLEPGYRHTWGCPFQHWPISLTRMGSLDSGIGGRCMCICKVNWNSRQTYAQDSLLNILKQNRKESFSSTASSRWLCKHNAAICVFIIHNYRIIVQFSPRWPQSIERLQTLTGKACLQTSLDTSSSHKIIMLMYLQNPGYTPGTIYI